MKNNGKLFKHLTAFTLSIVLLLGSSMTVFAGTWGREPGDLLHWYYYQDDGTILRNGWAKDDVTTGWYWMDENGAPTILSPEPGPLYMGPDGCLFVDIRKRSMTGAEGQQPLMSVPSAQKDIRYEGLRQLVDSIPLYPDATTGYPELDEVLNQVFAQIITPDMDTHDKLLVCYNYIMQITEYGYDDFMIWDMPGELSPVNAYGKAYGLLTTGRGVCDDYSAAFAVMAWKIGVPMCIANGYTYSNGGGASAHAWCLLPVNGDSYVFDPQIDDAIATRQGSAPIYIRFGGSLTKQLSNKYGEISKIFDIP